MYIYDISSDPVDGLGEEEEEEHRRDESITLITDMEADDTQEYDLSSDRPESEPEPDFVSTTSSVIE